MSLSVGVIKLFMIVKFFYKVGLRAYALSFVFSLAGISLINYCKNHEDLALNNILEIFVLWLIFTLFTIYVTFLQSKKLSSKLSGVHLLTFPYIFLFNNLKKFIKCFSKIYNFIWNPNLSLKNFSMI